MFSLSPNSKHRELTKIQIKKQKTKHSDCAFSFEGMILIFRSGRRNGKINLGENRYSLYITLFHKVCFKSETFEGFDFVLAGLFVCFLHCFFFFLREGKWYGCKT